MSKLFFFRHGQASINSANYDKLSDKGKKQAKLLGHHLIHEGIQFDRIFCGPLLRQKETENHVRNEYKNHNAPYPKPILLEGLKEHNGMEIFKSNYSQLLSKHSYLQQLQDKSSKNNEMRHHYYMEAFSYFMQKWALNALEIEQIPLWKNFRNEVKIALNTIHSSTQKGETIGVFSSGGTISAIVAESLGLEKEDRVAQINYSVRNASITQFLYSPPRFTLLEFNTLHFLPKEMITFV